MATDDDLRTNQFEDIDIRVENHGSIVLLRIETDQAEEWAELFIGGENGFQPYWPHAVVVEPRYVADIVEGAREAGLEVR